MSHEEMLSTYEVIAKITDEMCECAKHKDWERLQELELICKKYSEIAHTWNEAGRLSRKDIELKIESLNVILKNDKKIREYLEPWHQKLYRIMSKNKKINGT
jgi:flagellar protein FliT